jgi:hypothetical protein
MKTTLSDIYEQIFLSESEKSSLQNPSSDEVGNLKTKQELFGSKPKAVEGPEKAKVQSGPTYKETTGSSSSKVSSEKSTKMPNSAPAKETHGEKGKEMKDTDVDPTDENEEEDDKKKKKKHVEEGTSAFEALFKKTMIEEMEEESVMSLEEPNEEEEEEEAFDEEMPEEGEEEEEGDLISDLKDLQSKLGEILDKLEGATEETEDMLDDESYSEEDFDGEFGEDEEEEEEVREALEKPKALGDAKGKGLMKKKNKIGKFSPKKGKSHTGNAKCEPEPKALGDKKKALQKGKTEVKSSVKKGEFFK